MEQLAINDNSQFNALLSDQVVMQWLMDLESECDEAGQINQARDIAYQAKNYA
ncbi:MAG: hypothetical protein ACNA7J_06220 [Wenzhouxiangella sp.]